MTLLASFFLPSASLTNMYIYMNEKASYVHIKHFSLYPGIPSLPPPLPPMGAFPPPPLPPPITSASHHQFLPPPRHLYPHRPRQPHMFAPSPWKPSDTLIVRKIPRELNTVTKLSSHFEKFGTVVNLTVSVHVHVYLYRECSNGPLPLFLPPLSLSPLTPLSLCCPCNQVWYSGDPEGALVQFSTPFEARKAHDSAEAVLNNRFIRIYYLRKDMPYSAPQFMETSVEVRVQTMMSSLMVLCVNLIACFAESYRCCCGYH